MKKIVCLVFSFILLTSMAYAIGESRSEFDSIIAELSLDQLVELETTIHEEINARKIAGATLSIIDPGVDLAVGRTLKLAVESDGREITPKTAIKFESSDPEIATVQNDIVTGKNEGIVTIRASATFEDGAILEAEREVNVYIATTAVKISAMQQSVFVGDNFDISTIVSTQPVNATVQKFVYESSNPEVASISDAGILTGRKAGTATITITSAEKSKTPLSAKLNVAVNQAVQTIVLDKAEFDVGNGKTITLVGTVGPEDASNKKLVWTSDDPQIAKVSANGAVQGVSTGTTNITCTAADGSGISATAKVTVITAVNSVRFKKNEIVTFNGSDYELEAVITPANPTNPDLAWSSSDESIAKVDENGKITAESTGQCTITATTTDGTDLKAVTTVYVEPACPVSLSSIFWETSWGYKTGKMGIEMKNSCKKLTIKSVKFYIECVKGEERIGTGTITQGWSDYYTFTVAVQPGKTNKTKKTSVSGFANVNDVRITPKSVTFTNGTVYEIPNWAQSTGYYSPW